MRKFVAILASKSKVPRANYLQNRMDYQVGKKLTHILCLNSIEEF